MAIAFARLSVHTRTKGHSAIAAAAYRAGEKLFDERTGELYDYTERQDVIYSQIMLPEDANSKFNDRGFLWNQVERNEKRKDSQVAKDLILALPKEISYEDKIELARNFAYTHFVANGLVADIAIHDHDGNPHAHIYSTTRPLLGDRFGKKARDLNPEFTKGGFIKVKDYWGEQWRDFQNKYFLEHNLDLVVDQNHIISQAHEGKVRGEEAHYLKEENELRHQTCVEIALNDPDNLLNVLSTRLGVFSERDIASLVFKSTDSQEQFQEAFCKLKACKDLIHLGAGEDGRDRYTSRANYAREAKMGEHVDELLLKNTHKVSGAYVKKAIKRYGLNEEQAEALKHIAHGSDICAVVGRAGTGKSYMMGAAHEAWQRADFRVRGVALAGKAASELEKSSSIPCSTIQSLKMQIAYGSCKLTAKDILVVDEAGMVDLDMAILVEIVKATGAKLVLIGDHSQLQPIGPGAPFRAIVERIGFAEINTVIRQNDENDRKASMALSKGQVHAAIDYYHKKGQVNLHETANESFRALINDWQQDISAKNNLKKRVILAYRNVDVDALNQLARETLVKKGIVAKRAKSVITAKGNIDLAKGDQILFLRNNKSLGIFNGETATVQAIHSNKITVLLDNKHKLTFSTDEYQDFTYGYATTVHKAQGATFDNVFVYLGSKAWNKFLTYVALSRHRNHVALYADQETHKDLATLKTNLSRYNFKDTVLDWPLSFAMRRGFDPESMAGRFLNKITNIKQSIKDKWLYIVNYEAYLLQKSYQEKLELNQHRRNEARTIANFVDLHREIGRKWSDMHRDFPGDITKHPDYHNTYKQMLAKNQLANDIYKNIDKYTLALQSNNINIDSLTKAANAHTEFTNVQSYLTNYQQGRFIHCQKSAAEIQKEFKKHYGYLAYLSQKQKLPTKQLSQAIKTDAIKYYRKQLLKNLSQGEKNAFTVVDKYYQLDKSLRQSWSMVYKYGGLDLLSDNQLAHYHEKSIECDRLAYEISKHLKRYSDLLTIYNLDQEKLNDARIRHLNRDKVREYSEGTQLKRSELSANILSDKRYYRYVYEFNLDWKELNKQHRAFKHRQQLILLSAEQRSYFYLVDKYNKARIDTGIAWSKLIKDQEQNFKIDNNRLQTCQQLTTTRNALAFDIVNSYTKYEPFLQQINITLEILAKHASVHSKHLQIIQKQEQQTKELNEKITKAQYYYRTSKPIDKTIGETYLRKHRGIKGDISAFRYHPRIKDSDTNLYYPGIVIAAQNKDGQITGTQTILLDRKTSNKATVKVVKRTRGIIKGSAVQIHQGSSNKVIIAEGPETAASLITAQPEANIYVTLGNIKNAEALAWLAKKHNTNKFYFAADNDGKNQRNLEMLKDVAKTLKKHNIECFMSLPSLDGKEKCDFNDVLLTHGPEELKHQLSQTKPIKFLPEKTYEWDKLKQIDNKTTQWISRYYDLAQQKTDPKEINNIHKSMYELVGKVTQDTELLKKIKSVAPNLAKHFTNKCPPLPKTHEPYIDWKNPNYNAEWQKLKSIDNKDIQWLVRYHDLAQKKTDKKEIREIYNSMTPLITKITKDEKVFDSIKSITPKLAKLFQSHTSQRNKNITKDKSIDRDR